MIDTSSPSDASPCPAQALAPGLHELSIMHGGLQRTFRMLIPAAYTNSSNLPLLLNLHGLGGSASQHALSSSMEAKADQEGFLVVHPQGFGNSWNAGMCCGQASANQVDDVGFIRALIADLEQRVCLDRRRIYSTGMSNGGLMSYRLACEAADLIAAIAPVAATQVLASCSPSRPVPIIHFHGTADTLVNYTGATSTIAGWVSRNGCTDAQPAQTYEKGVASCEAYTQCDGQVEVEFCTITGGGHCWPGKSICLLGVGTTDISATDQMWPFLSRFSMP